MTAALYEDAPTQEDQRFTLQLENFLKFLHKLIFNLPSTVAGKYIDKFAFKKFLKCGNAAFEISQGFVDKEMKELKEMEDKRIN